MKFIQREKQTIEAFQWTGGPVPADPWWAEETIGTNPQTDLLGPFLQVGGGDDPPIARPGDFILLGDDGLPGVMCEEAFHANYEPVQ